MNFYHNYCNILQIIISYCKCTCWVPSFMLTEKYMVLINIKFVDLYVIFKSSIISEL